MNPKRLPFIFSCCLLLSLPFSLRAQNCGGGPCDAQRWKRGASWNANGTINDAPNAPAPNGIVRCGNSAETQSNIQPNSCYDPAVFAVELAGAQCTDPNSGSAVSLDAPFAGQVVHWMNLDVRQYAGGYDFQVISNDNVAWALFYVNPGSVTSGTSAQGANGAQLSGNCADLGGNTGAGYAPIACGTNFTGWAEAYFLTPTFDMTTNLYLLVWRRDASQNNQGFSFNLNFKARYGCGEYCSINALGVPVLDCINTDTYMVTLQYGGTSGTYNVVAPGALSVSPATLSFTSAGNTNGNSGNTGNVLQTVTATYPVGVDFNVTLAPTGTTTCAALTQSGTGISCQPACSLAIQCAATGGTYQCLDAIPAATAADVTVLESCGPTTVTSNDQILSGTGCSSSPYVVRRTYVVTDTEGNQATCAATFSVADTEAPVLAGVPTNTTAACDAVPVAANVTATDNCGANIAVTLGTTTTAGICASNYTLVRTWTATDGCGNTATAAQTIAVADTEAPVLAGVPTNTTAACDAVPVAANVTATDNCGANIAVTLSSTTTAGICASNYTLVRTWTATDGCGNTATAAQTIAVADTKAPVLAGVPTNTSAACDAVPAASNVTATDNCGANIAVTLGTITTAGICASNYTLVRTWTATDGCGNTATAAQTIAVADTEAPVLAGVPTNTSAACDAVPAAANVTATDNCGANIAVTLSSTTTTGICASNYTLVRTWTATDGCGNTATAAQTIAVADTEAPVLAGVPANVTVSCANVPAQATLTASDNCTANLTVNATSTTTPGICASNYTLLRVWTATDECGNAASVSQTVAVTDTQAPVLAGVPANTTIPCTEAAAPASVTAMDHCGGLVPVNVTTNTIPGNCPANYTVQYTWTADDGCGNVATATQSVEVADQEGPELAGIQAGLTASCTVLNSPPNVTASDNCTAEPTMIMTSSLAPGNCTGTYTASFTFTATDECGNATTGTQFITVIDNQAPQFANLPPSVTAELLPGTTAQYDDWLAAINNIEATDDCSANVTVASTVDFVAGCGNTGTYTALLTATDECGNAATATVTLTLTDTQAPEIMVVPENQYVECDSALNPQQLQAWLAANAGGVAQDGSEYTWTNDFAPANIEPGGCGTSFSVRVNFTATDDCGNSATRAATFVAWDQTAPVFLAPPQSAYVHCDDSCGVQLESWIANFGYAEIGENCGAVQHTTYQVREIRGPGNTYELVYRFIATNACGLQTIQDASFFVIDTVAPVITYCPPHLNLDCAGAIPQPQLAQIIATDPCSNVTVWLADQQSVGSGCVSHPMTMTYTYAVGDEAGNVAYCQQSFFVIDTTAPTLDLPDTVFVACQQDIPTPNVMGAVAAEHVTNGCAISHTKAVLLSPAGQTSPVTYDIYVADACGLYSQYTVTYVATGTCNTLCTAPAIDWGNAAAPVGNFTAGQLVDAYYASDNTLEAGVTGHQFSVLSGDCLATLFATSLGTTNTDVLPAGNLVATTGNCAPVGLPLIGAAGELNNALVANLMAMRLNIWFNAGYNLRDLAVQDLLTLPDCLLTDYLMATLGQDTRVVGLLNLIDRYLGNVQAYPPGFGEQLNQAAVNLLKYWNSCTVNDPCPPDGATTENLLPGSTPPVFAAEQRAMALLTNVALAPNPAQAFTTLRFEAAYDVPVKIRLRSTAGADVVLNHEAAAGENRVDIPVGHLPAGVYWVSLTTGDALQTVRLVVTRD